MSLVYVISDLHIGHKNIANFRKMTWEGHPIITEEQHRLALKTLWNTQITKRDVVWILGDVCFKADLLPFLDELRGRKRIVLGNHDLDGRLFSPHCEYVSGLARYKGMWLSHAPIHPDELRGKPNVHGHVHYSSIPDKRYFNACIENVGFIPKLMDNVIEHFKKEGVYGK